MRIVLVEPDRSAADVIIRMLEARHHEVWQFADGRDALAFILSDPDVSAVITSAAPQSISGLELCWETRLIAGNVRPIYVILTACNASEDQLVAALDHGADELLAKPLVAPHGRIVSMQARSTTDALAAAAATKSGLKLDEIRDYDLPAGEPRRLVIFGR